jgi:hypothetical protein
MLHGQPRCARGGFSILVVGAALLAGCTGRSDQADGGARPDGGKTDGPACMNSLGCGASQVCDTQAGRCVGCLTAADCPANNDCAAETCVPYTACMNSLGCPAGLVCDTTRMRCVRCVGDSDCAAGERCVGDDCRKKCASDNMCTPMGMLCDTTQMYCVSCLTTADCKASEYCSSGACVADVCTQGTSTCQNNAVVRCKSDGSGFDPPVACATGQTCDATTGAASCKTQACTPTVTYCDPATTSQKVLVCSADGLTSTVKSDCATSSQVCVAGACTDPVCAQGRFCQGQDLRQCTAKGDTSTLVQTCPATQYCDATSMMCKARPCTANQIGCNGNVIATCNADGTGFLPGGMSCDPNACSGGACISVLFYESFEDQSYARWTAGGGNYTISASSTPGANGTLYALSMTENSNASTANGLSYSFPAPVQPKTVSYWMKSANTSSGEAYTRLVNGTDVIVYTYFVSGRLYAIYGTGGAFSAVTAAADTWYHVELRNVDWTARSFDFYVDGTSVATARPFSGSATAIGRIELYNGAPTIASYWDEIELLP